MILLEVTHSLTSAFTVSLVGGRESARERERKSAPLYSEAEQAAANECGCTTAGLPAGKGLKQVHLISPTGTFSFTLHFRKIAKWLIAKFDSDLLPFEEINFQSEVDHFRLKIGWSYSCLWMILDPFCILEKMWLHESFWAAWSEKVSKEIGWVSKGRISALIMI